MKEDILNLHPTQISVGFQQVNVKADKMKQKSKDDLLEYLKSHTVPIIKGPKNKLYIIDHHHLCKAAYDNGIDRVFITILEDWSDKDDETFWQDMQDHHYVWLYDEHGSEITIDKFLVLLPRTIKELKNDPFRSIAGVLRRQGVYEKDWTPYSEFKWANFLRARMVLDNYHLKDNLKEFDDDILKIAEDYVCRFVDNC